MILLDVHMKTVGISEDSADVESVGSADPGTNAVTANKATKRYWNTRRPNY